MSWAMQGRRIEDSSADVGASVLAGYDVAQRCSAERPGRGFFCDGSAYNWLSSITWPSPMKDR